MHSPPFELLFPGTGRSARINLAGHLAKFIRAGRFDVLRLETAGLEIGSQETKL